MDPKKSLYKFLWSNHQTHYTIEMNLNGLARFRGIIWNQTDNIIAVSRNNTISCFHSDEDLHNDLERSKLFLDPNFSKEFFHSLKIELEKHKELFKILKCINFSNLSNGELFSYLIKATTQWTLTISYFRASQERTTHYLNEEIKKHFSPEELSVLMLPLELDDVNKELIDWQDLIKSAFTENKLLNHVEKYPWIAACHFTEDDVIETLTQKYKFDKINLKDKDIVAEKEELRKKQELILTAKPEFRYLIDLMQRIALSRMEVKSCWAGTDFFLIPLFEEIAKRTNELVYDLQRYYLLNEIKELLDGVKLSDNEKENRKNCFVGLWKDGDVTYLSGDKAEHLAKEELKELYDIEGKNEVSGTVANQGIAKGVVRVLRSNDIQQLREVRKTFQKGEILITQMTQPNIVDIAGRAGAIITDEGGMLSHAAIIAREFGVPCIVGTSNATKTFKNGDLVEVDADKGIVRKIDGQ